MSNLRINYASSSYNSTTNKLREVENDAGYLSYNTQSPPNSALYLDFHGIFENRRSNSIESRTKHKMGIGMV